MNADPYGSFTRYAGDSAFRHLAGAGCASAEFLGSWKGKPCDKEDSNRLIVAVRR